jgi:hypothetical protein
MAPAAPVAKRDERQQTIMLVQWALAMACAYLVLFSHERADTLGLGALVIVAFLAANLIVGRVRPATLAGTQSSVGIALLDTVLIAASLSVAGQLSVELLVLCLGILVLAIAGVRLGPLALSTLGMTAVYLLIAWLMGGESLTQSRMLLRVPFLFSVAIVYAWLAELGRQSPVVSAGSDAARALAAQAEAIARCQAALRDGAAADAATLLEEIAAHNRAARHTPTA